jgi:outer membrane protein assembly factor BamB
VAGKKMRTKKTLFVLGVLLIILPACGSDRKTRTPVESNFPLKQVQIFPSEEVIQKIAVSNSWIATYSSDKMTAIDTETQKILWSINFNVFTDFDSEFQISNDTLIAAATDQILLVDKSGSRRTLNLEPKGGNITRLVAIYPNHIYVIRGYDWTLEAYDTSQNTLLWTTHVGRGGADVFYAASKNIAYVSTRDKGIRAFDNSTGKVIWEQDRSSLQSAFEGGVLYTVEHTNNTNTFRFSAFNVESQKELWKQEITSITHVYKLTIIDKLLIASENDGLMALNKSNGEEVWKTDPGEPLYTRPVEFDDAIYVKGPSFTVYAISPSNGDVIGFVQLEKENPIFVQPKYEVLTGVYGLNDGIVVNTRNAVVIYKAK